MEDPNLRQENGYTIFEAFVNVNQGFGMRSTMQIVDECSRYEEERKIYFENKSYEKNPCESFYPGRLDGKSIMQMMFLCATKDSKLEVMVQGTDEKAKEKAKRLYRGIISKDGHLEFE